MQSTLSDRRKRDRMIGLAVATVLGAITAGILGREVGMRLMDIAMIADVALVLPTICWLFHAAGLRWQ